MDLVLLSTYEGPLVHVGVNFNVGVVAQLESILLSLSALYGGVI